MSAGWSRHGESEVSSLSVRVRGRGDRSARAVMLPL